MNWSSIRAGIDLVGLHGTDRTGARVQGKGEAGGRRRYQNTNNIITTTNNNQQQQQHHHHRGQIKTTSTSSDVRANRSTDQVSEQQQNRARKRENRQAKKWTDKATIDACVVQQHDHASDYRFSIPNANVSRHSTVLELSFPVVLVMSHLASHLTAVVFAFGVFLSEQLQDVNLHLGLHREGPLAFDHL